VLNGIGISPEPTIDVILCYAAYAFATSTIDNEKTLFFID
jgi:hypothetical protein